MSIAEYCFKMILPAYGSWLKPAVKNFYRIHASKGNVITICNGDLELSFTEDKMIEMLEEYENETFYNKKP